MDHLDTGGNGQPEGDRLLTVEDVADQLQVSANTVRFWVKAKRLGHVKVGRLVRFRQDHIVAFLSERPADPTSARDDAGQPRAA